MLTEFMQLTHVCHQHQVFSGTGNRNIDQFLIIFQPVKGRWLGILSHGTADNDFLFFVTLECMNRAYLDKIKTRFI